MKKKQALIDAAIKLFAQNGFDATSTASIGLYAGVTEPLIHYHFKSKDGLFTYILDTIYTEYCSRFDALPKETDTEFEKIENLIRFHFKFADDFPDETLIVVSACPAKLQEAAHTCTQYIKER
ncbi:MAG: TetR/AcrR family transcriptional regulator, partial [Desulfobulbaceae bacterium]|nr:TetR/AcrR family transcriptional regulator [Desulfobulbaceae bacterium]